MILSEIVFFLATLAAFPAGPDSIPCAVVKVERASRAPIVFACATGRPAQWVADGADSADFRRDVLPFKLPDDVAAEYRNGFVQFCVDISSGPAWRTCDVYSGGRLVGSFVRPGAPPQSNKRRERVAEGGH